MRTFSRLAHSVRSGLSDMSYAQRRLFAHRTGIDVYDHGHVPGIASTAAELEALYSTRTHLR